MDSYDKTKIGSLIAWGGEHIVYNYDTDKVIKFSMLNFVLGDQAEEKTFDDYAVSKKFFGDYLLETEIAISTNKKHIVHIQKKITGHPLQKADLGREHVRVQFREILKGYSALIEAGHPEIDLVGREGIFRQCLSNIWVTKNDTLVIFDATLLGFKKWTILKPFLMILRRIVLWRQNSILDLFQKESTN